MKKVWKGFAAAVSAAAIAATGFIGATSASALSTTQGDIKITNSVAGDQFDVYKVLDLTTSEKDGKTQYSYKLIGQDANPYVATPQTAAVVAAYNATVKDIVGKEQLVAPDAGATTDQLSAFQLKLTTALEGLTGDIASSDVTALAAPTAKVFADKLMAELEKGSVSATQSATAEGPNCTIENVEPGYYLMVQTAQSTTATENPNKVTKSAYLLDTVVANKTTDVTLKKGTVTVDKKVMDWNDSENSAAPEVDPSKVTADDTKWGSSADHDINDVIPFQLKGTLPDNYARYDTFQYVFNDTLSRGLTYNSNAKVYMLPGGEDAQEVDVTAAFDITARGGATGEGENITYNATQITVAAKKNDLKAALTALTPSQTATADSVFYVRYTATLNAGAQIGDPGNPNTVNLEFSNNPNNGSEGKNKTPDITVVVFTYQYDINKSFEGGTPTKGDEPEFTLYKKVNNSWTVISKQTMTSDNKFNFVGIDDGDYYVEETHVPQGFTKAQSVYFRVSATHNNDAEPTSTLTVKYYTDKTFTTEVEKGAIKSKIADGVISTDIVNKSGSELPSTGGMGTTILYAAGAAIVLIAGIGLAVTLRRRQA